MSDLATFLRERYAEARRKQERKYRDTWEWGDPCPACSRPTETMRTYSSNHPWIADFGPCGCAVNDPALLDRFREPAPDPAVLADLDSKLAIVDWHWAQRDDHTPWGNPVQICHCGYDLPCSTLRLLASVYAGHPDYKEFWRP